MEFLPFVALYLLGVAVASSLFDAFYRKKKDRIGLVARTHAIVAASFLVVFLLGLPLPKVGDWQFDLRFIVWLVGSQATLSFMLILLKRGNIEPNEAEKIKNTFAAFLIIPLTGVGIYLLVS